MRIPFLILCLAVVYGACQTYGEENVDVATKIHDDGDYKVNYANVPLENLLARHKRNLLTPITFPIDTVLKMLGFKDGVITTTLNCMKFMAGAMTGQNVCATVQLSFGSITKALTNPFQALQTIVCYVLRGIGSAGTKVMSTGLDLSIKFFLNVFLPGLHTTLNALNNTGLLPLQISGLITVFNLVYQFLQFSGYVPK